MKRFLACCFVGVLAFAMGEAAAHAIVTGSSLQERPVKAGSPTKVLLSFNSGIEVDLSRVFLVSG